MSGFSKKRFRLHRTASPAILVVYLIVTTSIDLFHSENCVLGVPHSDTTDVVSTNDICPACMFLAGHSSPGANYGPALVIIEDILISQFLYHLTVVRHNEWAYSIVSRAPPSITIS